MTMAYWNGMTWGVSNKQIAFLESFTTSFGIETKTNADKDGESPTEQVAKSLVEFSFNTTYRVETGTRDIRGTIDAWRSRVGKTGPLIIGNSTFGPDKMQLQSVDVSDLRVDASGVMRAVTLGFKFKEFAETESGVTTSTSPSQSATASSGVTASATSTFKPSRIQNSAVNIGAAKRDRDSKKTVNIKTNMVVRRELM